MSFSELLELPQSSYQTKHIEQLRELLESDTPVYLLGRNEDTKAVAEHFDFVAIIDDFVSLPLTWQDKPVIRLSEVPLDAIVINGVTNSRPRFAQEKLLTAGFNNSFYLADFCHVMSNTVPMLKFVTDSISDLTLHKEKWLKLYNALEDKESKQILIDVFKYRLTGDPRLLSNYDFRPEQQYFEDFLPVKNEVFVDGGGFQGETSIEFIKRYPDYKAILFFEPDPENIATAKENLSSYSNVEFFQVGLSDKSETLCFSAGDGSSAAITTDSEVDGLKINVEPLDNLASNASFIKLDLEGWELNALIGAEQQILNNKPKLALGLYHSPEDMCNVFEWLEQKNLGYKYSLRHYTQSWTETVLYAY